MTLTSKERKHLRGLSHPLSPAVHVGKQGLTDGVLGQIDTALTDHELIKVKMQADRQERATMVEEMASHTGAEVAGTIGGVAILYRPHPDPDKRRVSTA